MNRVSERGLHRRRLEMHKKVRNERVRLRLRRRARVRKNLSGTAERPRLSVFRSNKHVYAQVIDDLSGATIASASSNSKALAGELTGLSKKEVAKKVGEAIAKACAEKSVTEVVFDRNGFLYWGRVSAVAEGAREGLKF